jgi:tRNA-splicing ligase RtcB
LSGQEIRDRAGGLAEVLSMKIPSGLGSSRQSFSQDVKTLRTILEHGVDWAWKQGYATEQDRLHSEDQGCIPGAEPSVVSERALERGRNQLGTLGSGNHFVEVGFVREIFDQQAAAAMGLDQDRATVLIHTGSRGLGHQVCSDALSAMQQAARSYGIDLPDRQLCCAPLTSSEGRRYLAAMACAANFAFVNRQMITHWVREAFQEMFGSVGAGVGLELVYDVCHNIAKLETHQVQGRATRVCVHRKGATRAFPPGHRDVPKAYRNVGQPVLVPGDMGRCSYVLAGTEAGYAETFGSACHGAGRLMSRKQAKKAAGGRSIIKELEAAGIAVKGASRATLAEEMSQAYKDVNAVVDVLHQAGISRKVARLEPLAVIKG